MTEYPITVQQPPNMDLLGYELSIAFDVPRDTCGIREQNRQYFAHVPDGITLEQVQAVVNAHNPALLTTAQQETEQATNAKTALQQLMMGLHGLSAEDKGYAIYCRLLAHRNNASPQVIFGIVNRATAAAYVTSLPQWNNVPATSKPMLALMMETNAALTQVLLLVLSG